MLNIENVDKVIGTRPFGRYITRARQAGMIGSLNYNDHYEFIIDYQLDRKDYNQELRIFLDRNPDKSGLYPIFCMGLQSATVIKVHKRTLKSGYDFLSALENVLRKVQTYYQNN